MTNAYRGLTLILFTLTGLVYCLIPVWTMNSEPFMWSEGVSVWPSHLIRFAASLIAILGIWLIGKWSADGQSAIAAEFFPPAAFPASATFMEACWQQYANTRNFRIRHTIVVVAGYIALCATALMAFGEMPGYPIRGNDNILPVTWQMGFVVAMGLALLFAATVAHVAFIKGIVNPLIAHDHGRLFPKTASDAFFEMRQITVLDYPLHEGHLRTFVDHVLAMELVVRRSTTITSFVYFPFAVFTLLVVARNSIFDNWDTPPGLAVILCLPFFITVACSIWLAVRSAALRVCTVDRLKEQLLLIRTISGLPEGHLHQLDQCVKNIEDEDRGSFQNWTMQPLIYALLMVISGITGSEVLEHVLLAK